jgi:hypothetical protein
VLGGSDDVRLDQSSNLAALPPRSYFDHASDAPIGGSGAVRRGSAQEEMTARYRERP